MRFGLQPLVSSIEYRLLTSIAHTATAPAIEIPGARGHNGALDVPHNGHPDQETLDTKFLLRIVSIRHEDAGASR